MDPADRLYDDLVDFDSVPRGLPLIVALTGYRDAGQVVAQVTQQLLEAEGAETIASFDADSLFDFRARRPLALIEGTRVTAVLHPRLDVRLLRDALGEQFLFLSGYEPDYRWHSFVDDVVDLVSRLEVSTTTWFHGIPMPVPHTRPIRLSATGTRDEVAEAISVWNPSAEVPAHVLHALEFELGQREHPVLGLVALVPHYVADAPVPGAALAVIEGLATATGIQLETADLLDSEREWRDEVDGQVSANPEVQRLIAALEAQHDAYLAGLHRDGGLVDADGSLPSADEIAAEIERYLATKPDPDGQ